jgi:hypothetical protein
MVMEMFNNLPIHRYDFMRTHGVENLEIFCADPDNVSFMYNDKLYEFCALTKKKPLLAGIRNHRIPGTYKSGDCINLPYVFKFCNKEFNKLTGLPEDTYRYAHYTVFAMITTTDEEKAKIADAYVGNMYVELWKRLLRSYERLPVKIYCSYEEHESIFKRLKRWIGLDKSKPPIVQHMYQLDLDRMKLHQIVRNISADYKKKMDPADLNKLNSSGLIMVVNTNTFIQSLECSHVEIGRVYRNP